MTSEPLIRPIQVDDESAVAQVIRTVMPEFGADGPGFALHDPEVGHMFEAFQRPGCAYFVVVEEGQVAGGGGVAPLAGAGPGVCELQKMYFLPGLRGRGLGERLLRRCLEQARHLGYRTCYLETLTSMRGAQKLYGRLGFRPMDAPLGCTGHHGCDKWFIIELEAIP